MLHLAHIDGGVVIQLTEIERGIYEITKSERGAGTTHREKTTSYQMGAFLYLQQVANEIAQYGDDPDKITQIEDMVVPPKPGTW